MNKQLEDAAEKYLEDVNDKVHKDLERDGWLKVGFIKGATHVQETELKEARELIEGLKNDLSEMLTKSFAPSHSQIKDLITKAETFLNK